MSIDSCVGKLRATPVSPTDARRPSADGGLPAEPGFYAWWVGRGSLAGVPQCPHPSEANLDLLYVGIAPANPSSGQSLQSRVLGNHLGGNTGSSTFRLSLAGLLMDELDLHPLKKQKKVLLASEENRALSEWQMDNLAITWCECANPWEIEGEVIAAMEPPLNLAGNAAHPFHTTLSAARKRFRESAA